MAIPDGTQARVGVVGAGAWGTALAKLVADQGVRVVLWCREPEVVASIRERHVNELFLPDAPLPESLVPTGDLADATSGKELVIVAVPSRFLRSVVSRIEVSELPLFVSATKGVDEDTLERMSEVIEESVPGARVVAISGPTFAKEVARGEPTALVAASRFPEAAKAVQERLSTKTFRIYTNDDVIGVELGGALKNVIALTVGVAAGLGLGYNPAAALMTRGLAEISRLCVAMGGRRDTLAGLAGMGDLVLTCTGALSRNRTVGVALGEGRSLEDILSGMRQVAEGVGTTHAAMALSRAHDVEMPIVNQMERLLKGEISAAEAMDVLLSRPLKSEH